MKNTNGNDKLKREKNASRNRVHTTVQENETQSGRERTSNGINNNNSTNKFYAQFNAHLRATVCQTTSRLIIVFH